MLFSVALGPDGSSGEPSMLFELELRIVRIQPRGDRFLAIVESDEEAAPAATLITGWRRPAD
jgi:hypothetical protein